MKATQKYYLTVLTAISIAWALHTEAASVGPAGYTNAFSSLPAATDFATAAGVIGGGSSDIGSTADLDSSAQNVSASSITSPLVNSSPTNPPAKLASAQWT